MNQICLSSGSRAAIVESIGVDFGSSWGPYLSRHRPAPSPVRELTTRQLGRAPDRPIQGGGGMGRRTGGGEGGEGEQAGQEAGRPAQRGGWRQGAWRRCGHDQAGGGRQARMLMTTLFKGVEGRDPLGRELEVAWDGALVGLESQQLRIGLIVSESR